MGGGCSCATADDDDMVLSKSHVKRELHLVIRRNTSAGERRATVTRRLSVANEIEEAIKTHAMHQEELDLCIAVLEQMEHKVFVELRSMKAPPDTVINIIAIAAMILGETDIEWKSLQKYLVKSKDPFLEYDFDNANRDDISKAMAYADSLGSLFGEGASKFASEATYYIFIWCRAIFQLHRHRVFLEEREVGYMEKKLYSTRSFREGQIEESLRNGDPVFVKQDSKREPRTTPADDFPKMENVPSSYQEIDHDWLFLEAMAVEHLRGRSNAIMEETEESTLSKQRNTSVATADCVE